MKETSKWWWIGGNHNNTSNSSSWLNSTLSELDSKTKEMLGVIDEVDDEADSFAKRAKVYYEKKPKLVAMVQDLYRSHRSLAQRYDLLIKTSSLMNPYRHESPTCDEFQSELSEETTETGVDDGGESGSEEDQIVEFGETMKEELERLREENRAYKKRQVVTSLFTNSIIRICFRALLLSCPLRFIFSSPFAILFTIWCFLF